MAPMSLIPAVDRFPSSERPRHGLLERAICGKRPGPAMAAPGYFPPPPASAQLRDRAGFASRSKIAGLRHPSLRFGPPLRFGCRPGPPAAFRRQKAAMGAADPTKESLNDYRS